MFVYIVETGLCYEGGGCDEVFSSYEAALKSKPSCFYNPRKDIRIDIPEHQKIKNTEDNSLWYDSSGSYFFSIKKFEVLEKTQIILKTCAICKNTNRPEDLYDAICWKCKMDCADFRYKSLMYFERFELIMNEALE